MGDTPISRNKKDLGASAESIRRSQRRAWLVLFIYTALVAGGLALAYALFPEVPPSPEIMIASLFRNSRNHLSGREFALAMIGWALFGAILSGYVLILARYRLWVRQASIARYCAEAGLLYVANPGTEQFGSVHRFQWHNLVPGFELSEVDDVVVAPSRNPRLVFSEVTLKTPQGLGGQSFRTVFHGGLLKINLATHRCGAVEPPRGWRDRFEFERVAGCWRVPARPGSVLADLRPLLEELGKLAEGLGANSIRAALDEDDLFVAIAYNRDLLPVPRFWRPGGRSAAFDQSVRDVTALAAVAEAAGVLN